MRQGLVRACHDLTEGGLAVSAAEMCIAGRLGMQLDLVALPRATGVESDAVALFAESSARFLAEVAPSDVSTFEQALAGHPCTRLGRVTEDGFFRVSGFEDQAVLVCRVDDLRCAWQSVEIV